MTYGANLDEINLRIADLVDKILRGANPSEIPVEQVRTIEFAINLRTAKAMGLTFPPSVLLQANRVME